MTTIQRMTFEQRDGKRVTAPEVIGVPMEIGNVRLIYRDDGRYAFQVDGHVGDYNVLLWLNDADAKAAGIRVA